MSTLKRLSLLGPLALALAGPAMAQRDAEIRVCDRPNLNGQCIDLRHGVGDLRQFDFAQRVTSFEIRSGTWLMCSQPAFGGRCEAFDQSVGNLRRTGFNNTVGSLRPVRAGGSGQDMQRTSITLYGQPNFRGRAWTFGDDQTDLTRYGISDRISSIRVSGGRWRVCADANYGRCVDVTGDVANLRQIGLDNSISSLQEIGAGAPGGPGVPGGAVTLYEDSDFRGRTLVVERAVRNLQEANFNDRISSLRVPPGEQWTLCTDANFGGRCATVTGDVANLSPFGLNDRVSSLRRTRR